MDQANSDLPDGLEPDQVAKSKAEARQNDLRYFRGNPCQAQGHVVRYLSSGSCLECTRAKGRNRKRRKARGDYEERTGPFTGEYLPEVELDVLSQCFLYALRTELRERTGLDYCGYFLSEIRAIQAYDGGPPDDWTPGDPIPDGFEYLPRRRGRGLFSTEALEDFEPWPSLTR